MEKRDLERKEYRKMQKHCYIARLLHCTPQAWQDPMIP